MIQIEREKPSARDGALALPMGWRALIAVSPFVYLWWILIDQLGIECSVNPQYAYGWAVPFLCVYLAWRRCSGRRASDLPVVQSEPTPAPRLPTPDSRLPTPDRRLPTPDSRPPTPVLLTAIIICAFLLAPTRLIQEANPEWRLVSWALAIEGIGLTLLALNLGVVDQLLSGAVSRSEPKNRPTDSPTYRLT